MIYKLATHRWYLERLVYLVGGVFTLVSVIAGFTLSANFFYFTGFVGLMQIIFALTGYCPLAIFLHLIGIKER